MLVALDGTEYFCSRKLGCPQCLTRRRSNGKVESDHCMLCGTIVAPGHAMVLPLIPEFIALQDGAERQDRERNAVKRWLATPVNRVIDLWPIFLGDDLFACQPVADAMAAAGGDFLLTAKPTSQKAVYNFSSTTPRRRSAPSSSKVTGKRLAYHCRRFNNSPLRNGEDATLVDWVGVIITVAKGKVTYQGAFVTLLAITRDTVAEIVACARTRWQSRTRTSASSSATATT